MSPQDVIWRILERLTESKAMIAASAEELHPRKHADLIDALRECEMLTQTQINLLNRMRRRYDNGGS